MRHQLRRSSSAFTLLEVILAIAISSILLFAVLLFYKQAAQVREEVSKDLEVTSAARRVLENLTDGVSLLQFQLPIENDRFHQRTYLPNSFHHAFDFGPWATSAGCWPARAKGSAVFSRQARHCRESP